MISFKNFLAESRDAPLYHSTSIDNLPGILQFGLYPKTVQDFHKIAPVRNERLQTGVSLTRNWNFATKWNGGYNAIIEFDQRRLNQNFKIVPFQFWSQSTREQEKDKQYSYNEYEEFVPTKKPIPVKYITCVWIHAPMIAPGPWSTGSRRIVSEIREKYGSQFIRIY